MDNHEADGPEVFVDQAEGQVVDDLLDNAGAESQQDMDTGSDEEEQETDPQVADDSIHSFEGHRDTVYTVAWNPAHPLQVATGGGDDKAFLWQVGEESIAQAGAGTIELRGHTDTVGCVGFNSSGTLLASGGLDGVVRIWDASSGACLRVLDGPTEGIEWLQWHPKGDLLLVGSEDFTAWLWNANTGACMLVLTGHSGPVRCGCFLPNGKGIMTGGGDADHSLRFWNPKTGECTITVQDDHSFHAAGLTTMAAHPDSTTVITGSEDGVACLVNAGNGRVLGRLAGHTDSIEAIALCGQLSLVATSSVDGDVRIWDASTLSTRAICSHPEAVVRLACHPQQPLLYSACLDGNVRCWDLRTGLKVFTRTGHRSGIQDLALNNDITMAITGSDDHTARIFML